MRPFLRKKKGPFKRATWKGWSLHPALNIIHVLSIHVHVFYIYISQVKTHLIHSQKESRKCRTLNRAKGNIETRRGFVRGCRLESNWIRDTRRGMRRFGVGCEHAIHHGAMNAVRST